MRDYYLDASYGQLDIHFDVYGPYTLANNIAYYDYYTTHNANQTASMVVEATALAQADGCNFANYDINNDGKVDAVHFMTIAADNAMQLFNGTLWLPVSETS